MTREEISALLTRRRQALERRDIVALANIYRRPALSRARWLAAP